MSRVDIEVDISSKISDKIESIINSPEVMLGAHKALAEVVDPYVPYDTGKLSKTVQVTSEGVTYTAPYAKKQYYGDEFHHKTEVHPLATAHWDEVALQTQKDVLVKKIEDVIRQEAKNG